MTKQLGLAGALAGRLNTARWIPDPSWNLRNWWICVELFGVERVHSVDILVLFPGTTFQQRHQVLEVIRQDGDKFTVSGWWAVSSCSLICSHWLTIHSNQVLLFSTRQVGRQEVFGLAGAKMTRRHMDRLYKVYENRVSGHGVTSDSGFHFLSPCHVFAQKESREEFK
jgi:hypothetical protein